MMVDGEAAVANDQHACLSSQAASLPPREENSYGPIPSRYCAKVGFGSYAMKTQSSLLEAFLAIRSYCRISS